MSNNVKNGASPNVEDETVAQRIPLKRSMCYFVFEFSVYKILYDIGNGIDGVFVVGKTVGKVDCGDVFLSCCKITPPHIASDLVTFVVVIAIDFYV